MKREHMGGATRGGGGVSGVYAPYKLLRVTPDRTSEIVMIKILMHNVILFPLH